MDDSRGTRPRPPGCDRTAGGGRAGGGEPIRRLPASRARWIGVLLAGATLVAGIPPALDAQAVRGSGSRGVFFDGARPSGGSTGPASPSRGGRKHDHRPVERVPINPHTLADGTANTLQPVPESPSAARFRQHPGHADRHVGGPVFQYLFPTRVVAVPYAVVAPSPEPEPRRRRLGRVPDRGATAAMPGADAGGRQGPEGTDGADDPDGTDGADRHGGASDDRAPLDPTAIPRLLPPDPDAPSRSLTAEECAEVRIATAGGIQWRRKVSTTALGVESRDAVAPLLQERLHAGELIELEGPDGYFSIPAAHVQSVIVGPCRI